MKNKLLIIIGIVLILVIGIGIGVYTARFGLFSGQEARQPKAQKKEDLEKKNNLLVKDDFSLVLPKGWKEAPSPSGISAMVVNAEEKISDIAAKKINFRSYFSVKYDTLNGRNKEEYIEFIKKTLIQAVPGITFIYEEPATINNKDVYFIEAEVTQQGVDFKILISLIRGNEDDAWILSFNTTKANWPEYKDVFYQIARSFRVK
ncbi:hypothetical protein DRN73_07200 [Candidatus Pacearchaeota archaeon]|nr:MAG: hypothetical protein DRN73_07200 [Candidatus Pacearchaeota archaeon]